MAPPRGGKGGTMNTEEAKERLTAVVMADSFNLRFRPVSAESPKVLRPLVNVPMLDYTLEWLSMNCVEEVVVFCCAHAGAVEGHLEAGGWLKPTNKMKITPVVSTNCLSQGDALRLLDHKDIIKTDFVLISGDVVTNMKLSTAFEAHKKRRGTDKSAIMTIVMKGGMSPAHRIRMGASGVTTVIDPTTSRLLKYDEHAAPTPWTHQHNTSQSAATALTRKNRGLRLDASLFSERDDITIRSDLIDTGVYICAPEVLMLFSDNFDYQNIKRDFVSGVLSEEELGNKLYVHEVTKEYIARVHSMRSYDAVSRDVLARWTYPLVPDTNLFSTINKANSTRSRTVYRYNQGMVYLDQGVFIDRSAKVENGCAIGTGSSIADAVRISQSVIGKNCEIKSGAVLRGCYLGDNVIVGEGVVANSAMLCDHVVVKEGAVIEPNTVLCDRVVIDRRTTVPSGSKISLVRPPIVTGDVDDSDDELEVPQSSTISPRKLMGSLQGGSHRLASFSDSDEDDSDNEEEDDSDNEEEDDDDNDLHGISDGRVQHDVALAAAALASDGIPETTIDFSFNVVGAMGAGFLWPRPASEASVESSVLMGLQPPVEAMRKARQALTVEQLVAEEEEEEHSLLLQEQNSEALLAGGGAPPGVLASGASRSFRALSSRRLESGALGGDDDDGESLMMMEATASNLAALSIHEPHFKREVAETFLRCVKENISHENVVIELNGLKIAEDKTFADCARYMLTTALGLCLPSPPTIVKQYRGLYNPVDVDTGTKEGKIELLKRATVQLRRWSDLLTKFLKNEEGQVELLLTLEEFCGEEGDFEGTGERGAQFASIFPQLLKTLYEEDIVSEEALMAWGDEKKYADEEEKRFLNLAQPFLDWLNEAEEEEEEEEEESEDE